MITSVFVKFMNGKSILVDYSNCTTIKDLKNEIIKVTKLKKVNNCKIIIAGDELKNNVFLKKLKLHKINSIHFIYQQNNFGSIADNYKNFGNTVKSISI